YGAGLAKTLAKMARGGAGLPLPGRLPEPHRGEHRRPGLRPGNAHRGDRDDRLLPANRQRLGEPGHQRGYLLRARDLLHRGLRPLPATGNPPGTSRGPGDRRHLSLPLRAPALPGPADPGDRRQLPGAGETWRPLVPAGRDERDYAESWERGPGAAGPYPLPQTLSPNPLWGV